MTMNEEQKTLIFRFRYSLRTNGKALVKFLQSAQLDDKNKAKEAMKLFE